MCDAGPGSAAMGQVLPPSLYNSVCLLLHPTALAPLALLSDPPQGAESLLLQNKARKEKERLVYNFSSEQLSEMLLKHKLTSVLTDHWAFLQH